jgi:hypothetical protein
MRTRLLLAHALWFLIALSLPHWGYGQTGQTQNTQAGVPPAGAPAPDQAAGAQQTPATSTNQTKPTNSPAIADQSSTIGNPASSRALTVKGKLRYFAVESFRPGIYPVAAFYDGLTMANPPKAYPPEWRQGFPGFARNYGDFMGSWASVQGGKFIVASMLHEDPRYFTSTSRNFIARTFNAVRYAVIDRSDKGRARFALSNVAGAFAGGFVGNAYLPDPYANPSHGLSRSALALTGFITSNLADEFRPEIHKVAEKLHLPFRSK